MDIQSSDRPFEAWHSRLRRLIVFGLSKISTIGTTNEASDARLALFVPWNNWLVLTVLSTGKVESEFASVMFEADFDNIVNEVDMFIFASEVNRNRLSLGILEHDFEFADVICNVWKQSDLFLSRIYFDHSPETKP